MLRGAARSTLAILRSRSRRLRCSDALERVEERGRLGELLHGSREEREAALGEHHGLDPAVAREGPPLGQTALLEPVGDRGHVGRVAAPLFREVAHASAVLVGEERERFEHSRRETELEGDVEDPVVGVSVEEPETHHRQPGFPPGLRRHVQRLA